VVTFDDDTLLGGVRTWDYLVLDVFTDTPLEGNPLAVFPDASGIPGPLMQRTARELNLSETVFVQPAKRGGDARIRIFTPTQELPFAGHPTLGAAFVVGTRDANDRVRLETGIGVIPVDLERRDGRVVFGWLTQPVPRWRPYEHAGEVLDALGVASSELPVEAYDNGPLHVYVTLADEEEVAALQPDLARLARLEGVGVNAIAGVGRRWRSRMFGPGLGVDEDPATGSAAGPLAVHLVRHGRLRSEEELEIRQGRELGRPSRLLARVEGSATRMTAVQVGGAAVVVAQGRYRLR
jgi:trans-2,3-dihydro-3-hydroxyanthranilate isomerase